MLYEVITNWRFQFQYFRLKQNVLEQLVDASPGFGRNTNERRIATILFGNDGFRDQFLLDAIRVGFGLVDFVHRNDDRDPCSLGMVDRFTRLRRITSYNVCYTKLLRDA